MKLLLYCEKAKPYLLDIPKDNEEFEKGIKFSMASVKEFEHAGIDVNNYKLNGKIVAEGDFEVSIHNWYKDYNLFEKLYYQENMMFNNESSCMSSRDLVSYLGNNNLKKDFYAIHIKNLHIFDEPKELSEYFTKEKKINTLDGYNLVCESIDRAPQNMMYAYDNGGNKYILISIKPEALCKILNGDKTIEIRKKVLKGMLQ